MQFVVNTVNCPIEIFAFDEFDIAIATGTVFDTGDQQCVDLFHDAVVAAFDHDERRRRVHADFQADRNAIPGDLIEKLGPFRTGFLLPIGQQLEESPHVSGIELMQLLRADDGLKDVPIMAVTAYSAQGDDERIRAAGASAYVSKPISVVRFAETVDQLLAGEYESSGPASGTAPIAS